MCLKCKCNSASVSEVRKQCISNAIIAYGAGRTLVLMCGSLLEKNKQDSEKKNLWENSMYV